MDHDIAGHGDSGIPECEVGFVFVHTGINHLVRWHEDSGACRCDFIPEQRCVIDFQIVLKVDEIWFFRVEQIREKCIPEQASRLYMAPTCH